MRRRAIHALLIDMAKSSRREESLTQLLQTAGLTARSLRDTKRAAQRVAKGEAQLVFVIPGRRAPESLGSILARMHTADPDVPVVLWTPRADVAEATEALRGRAYDYLDAGESPEALFECIERILVEKGYTETVEERFLKAVGQRLRTARGQQGLTLKQLAHRTGLSVSLLSQIELAKSAASLATLYKATRALRIKLHELFAGY